MIFLTSYDRDFNIFHSRGSVVRKPTLHLCGEYQAFDRCLGFFGRETDAIMIVEQFIG